MPLYEVAAIQKPTKKEADDGVVERLLFGPKAVVARDDRSAAISAVMGETIDMNTAEVLVRPF